MSKAEERAVKEYPKIIKRYRKLGDMKENTGSEYDENLEQRVIYIKGYRQAEKDLLENKHETSWRLDEKLWKGIKDIEEASYQYMYDASNDWAYDIPTWNDVQDAFKAGSEWKEGLELTWKDMMLIHRCIKDAMNFHLYKMMEGVEGQKVVYQEVLKRFKEQKGEKV